MTTEARIMRLERDLVMMGAQKRECSEHVRKTLSLLSSELGRMGADVADMLKEIRGEIRELRRDVAKRR